jgi:DtxR family Mn-dependent transcriptional regulator
MVKVKESRKRLTQGIEDYLEAIHVLSLEREVVRVRDIARSLKVSMPSVTGMLSKLRKQGLASHERYESVSLTRQGKKRAEAVYRRHMELTHFLKVILGIKKDKAEEQACRLEHAVSEETLSRLTKLIDYIGNCRLGREHWTEGFHEYLKTGRLTRMRCQE